MCCSMATTMVVVTAKAVTDSKKHEGSTRVNAGCFDGNGWGVIIVLTCK